MSACPILPCQFPIERVNFQLEVSIPDRHYGMPIEKLDFRSEFWIFDQKFSFSIGLIFFKMKINIKEKKSENNPINF